jgi:hypothetical protein
LSQNIAQHACSEVVSQLTRRARTQQFTHYEAQVEGADMDQLTLQYVPVPAQVRAPHAAGFVAMCETAFDELTAPLQ